MPPSSRSASSRPPDIQILVKDDRGTADGARAAASQAISEGAELILGPLFAQSVPAGGLGGQAAPTSRSSPSRPTATTASSGVYLLSFLPQTDVDRIVRYAGRQGKRSFAALLPTNAYGAVVEAALQTRRRRSAGGRVVSARALRSRPRLDAGEGDGDRRHRQAGHRRRHLHARRRRRHAVPRPDPRRQRRHGGQDHASSAAASGTIRASSATNQPQRRLVPGARQCRLRRLRRALPGRLRLRPDPQRRRSPTTRPALPPASPPASARSASRTKMLTTPSGFIGIDGAFRFLANGTQPARPRRLRDRARRRRGHRPRPEEFFRRRRAVACTR